MMESILITEQTAKMKTQKFLPIKKLVNHSVIQNSTISDTNDRELQRKIPRGNTLHNHTSFFYLPELLAHAGFTSVTPSTIPAIIKSGKVAKDITHINKN